MVGKLITYQNSNMSLSCKGEMCIFDNIIVSKSFKGYPRTHGDEWVGYYNKYNVGDFISKDVINRILSFNGHMDVISKFTPKDWRLI